MLLMVSVSLIAAGAFTAWVDHNGRAWGPFRGATGGALVLAGLLILGAGLPISHRGGTIAGGVSVGQQGGSEVAPIAG